MRDELNGILSGAKVHHREQGAVGLFGDVRSGTRPGRSGLRRSNPDDQVRPIGNPLALTTEDERPLKHPLHQRPVALRRDDVRRND